MKVLRIFFASMKVNDALSFNVLSYSSVIKKGKNQPILPGHKNRINDGLMYIEPGKLHPELLGFEIWVPELKKLDTKILESQTQISVYPFF